MKQILVSAAAAGMLLHVLLHTDERFTRLILLPVLVFAVGIGLKAALVMLKKQRLAAIAGKVCSAAFLVYWFGFLLFWACRSIAAGEYMQLLFTVPFWPAGVYLARKRLFR